MCVPGKYTRLLPGHNQHVYVGASCSGIHADTRRYGAPKTWWKGRLADGTTGEFPASFTTGARRGVCASCHVRAACCRILRVCCQGGARCSPHCCPPARYVSVNTLHSSLLPAGAVCLGKHRQLVPRLAAFS